MHHEKGVRPVEYSTTQAAQEKLAPPFSGDTLIFDIPNLKLFLQQNGQCQELIAFSESTSYYCHLLRYLLTATRHSQNDLAQIYSEITKLPVVATRLQNHAFPRNAAALLQDMQGFLAASSLAEPLAGRLRLDVVIAEGQRGKKSLLEARVHTELPFYLPYAFHLEQEARTDYNQSYYSLGVGGRRAAKTVGGDVVALVSALHQASQDDLAGKGVRTTDELLEQMLASLPRRSGNQERTQQTVITAYRNLIGADVLTRRMVLTDWQPGQKDSAQFWLNPMFVPSAQFDAVVGV
jgi:hypothetical protein